MRSHFVILFAVAVMAVWTAPQAHAHHATASFDMAHSMTVKGTVSGFDWTNPHVYIYVDVKNDKGAVEKWSIEMASTGMLSRAGWRRDTVKAGDEITVMGNRARDGRPFLHLSKVVFANGQELGQSAQ